MQLRSSGVLGWQLKDFFYKLQFLPGLHEFILQFPDRSIIAFPAQVLPCKTVPGRPCIMKPFGGGGFLTDLLHCTDDPFMAQDVRIITGISEGLLLCYARLGDFIQQKSFEFDSIFDIPFAYIQRSPLTFPVPLL